MWRLMRSNATIMNDQRVITTTFLKCSNFKNTLLKLTLLVVECSTPLLTAASNFLV